MESSKYDCSSKGTLRVLMLPWLAHGHVSPFLRLAKALVLTRSGGGGGTPMLQVCLCSTPINLSSINKDHPQLLSNSIQLVELHLPTLPPRLHTTKHLPPHLMPALKEAFDLAEPSFRRILLHTPTPHLLVYDFLQPWAPAAARRDGIPAVLFLTTGAASAAFFCHCLTRPAQEFPFPALRFRHEAVLEEDLDIGEMLKGIGFSDAERQLECQRASDFIAVRSFREIESKYIDYLSFLTGKEIVPVGPLLLPDEDDDAAAGGHGGGDRVTEWLSGKEGSSVVFVSFGSEYFMSEEETEEIARGLELSGVSFIWVVRFPDEDNTGARALPLGFLERVGGESRGMVVEGWAPQRRILAHPTVGGFLTHCGWGSVMEGMWSGVPMIALPLHLDQPLNAKLVVELGVGVEIRREGTDGFGRFRGEEVARGIRDVMVDKRGEDVRRKAEEMAATMGRKGNEEVQVLAEKMAALCNW